MVYSFNMEVFIFINKIIFTVLHAIKGALSAVGSDWAAAIGSFGTLYFTIKSYKENKKSGRG